MSAREKSDLPVVAEKRANKAASAAAELVERRGGAKENAELQSTVRTQSRAAVSQAQARIREAVTRNRQDKLTALLHHLTVDVLRASFFGLKKSAAPGVDEMTWTEYAEGLEENLADLHSRVQTGAYRALPSRRTYIPKADGRQRPLGIAALEDKIVQAAVVAILTPIYEAEFQAVQMTIGSIEKRIVSQHRSNEESKRLETIPGIGVIGATAIAASVPDARVFRSGRDLAAWSAQRTTTRDLAI